MNIGLVSSFITGGILLISILALHLNLFQNSNQTTMDVMSMDNLKAVVEVVDHDFTKIGYGVSANVFTSADSNQVTYQSDIDDDGTINTVSWRFNPGQPNTQTPNPNDFTLQRVVDGNTLNLGLNVTDFELTYFTINGTVTTNPDSIRQLRVNIICQAPAEYRNRFAESAWEKTYIPINFFLK